MSILIENVLAAASKLSEGEVLSPKDFLHLGSRMAIDQTLSRLAKQGQLIRIGRGTYVAPITSRFGSRPPAVEKTMKSLAEKTGEIVASHGAAAANALGLTTQVPIREIFITSGPSRKLTFASRVIELKQVPHWQLIMSDKAAGMAIRALAWLGQTHIEASLKKIYAHLSTEEWQNLVAVRSSLPSWMAENIGKVDFRIKKHGRAISHSGT
jgi:DNA-binding GntR family transcriptional regulator